MVDKLTKQFLIGDIAKGKFRTISWIRGGGSGIVFALKTQLFWPIVTFGFLNVPRNGGCTGLGNISKFYQFFLTPCPGDDDQLSKGKSSFVRVLLEQLFWTNAARSPHMPITMTLAMMTTMMTMMMMMAMMLLILLGLRWNDDDDNHVEDEVLGPGLTCSNHPTVAFIQDDLWAAVVNRRIMMRMMMLMMTMRLCMDAGGQYARILLMQETGFASTHPKSSQF